MELALNFSSVIAIDKKKGDDHKIESSFQNSGYLEEEKRNIESREVSESEENLFESDNSRQRLPMKNFERKERGKGHPKGQKRREPHTTDTTEMKSNPKKVKRNT